MRISQIYSDITQIINRSHADLQDLTSADDHTQYLDVAKVRPPKNIFSGNTASKPGTCAVGDIYFDTQAIRLYLCQATNTWDQALPELHKATHASGGTDGLTAAQMAGLMLLVATTQGDVLIRGASTVERLAPGTSGYALITKGAAANPEWGAVPVFASPINIFGREPITVSAGTWAFDPSTHMTGGYWRPAVDVADGTTYDFTVCLAAGTYTLVVIYSKCSACGVLDFDLAGSEIASVDTYAASDIDNSRSEITSITVATSGIKQFRIRIDGKNGSSSAYYFRFACATFIRTA